MPQITRDCDLGHKDIREARQGDARKAKGPTPYAVGPLF